MTRDGLVEHNETTGDSQSISKRDADFDLHGVVPDGDIPEVSINAARSTRQGYSQVGNNPGTKAETRNKKAYQRHYAQRASEAVEDEFEYTQERPSATKHPQHVDTNTAYVPSHADLSTMHIQPHAESEDSIQISHSPQTDSRLRTQRNTSYSHSRPSALHEVSAVSALQEKPPDEPTLIHHSSTEASTEQAIDVTETRKPQPRERRPPPRSNDGLSDIQPTPTSESGQPTQNSTDSKLQFAQDEAVPERPKSRKLAKAEKGVKRANAKLDKAKDKLPSKSKTRSRLVFDEDKGKPKRELYTEKKITSQSEHIRGSLLSRPIKSGASSALAFGHKKIFQVEHENVEIKAAHRGEMAAESGIRGVLRHRKTRAYKRVAKLEHKAMKENINVAYRQALEKNPKLSSNFISRMWQKRKVKKQYAKAAREAKRAAGGIKSVGSFSLRATKLVHRVILKNPKTIVILLVAGLIISMLMSILSLGMSFGGGGMGAVFASSYLSDESDIDNAALAYSEWEVELLTQIANAQTEFPGFDEYRFNVGMVDHNPLELMAYLTAVHHIFTYPEIRDALRNLFDAQYQLTFTPSIETRHFMNEDDYPVPYEWHVLTVTLATRSLADVIHERLSEEQRQHFDILMQTSGQRQIVGSPFDFNWLPFVTSNYGWRIHPISNSPQLHRGIDIGLPTGTPILAAHDGVVTFAGWQGSFGNVVFIEGEDGIETRYAHCDTMLVSVGQTVSMGDTIATVGSTGESTGPHLHFEVLRNGAHLNPIFFAYTNAGMGSFPVFGNPGAPMGDGTFEALLQVARSVLGAPYVWGANGPNSFDCSGFVFWTLNQSGAANVYRTTAQGYYNKSRPVSPSDARPGDLIFFENTFSSPRRITHVGIYLGGGQMIHTGSNPNGVEIISFNTPFWQRHFAGFGRIADF